MKVTVNDFRHEDRTQRRIAVDGVDLTEEEVANYRYGPGSRTAVADERSVSVTIDEFGDTVIGHIPEVLPNRGYRAGVNEFFVGRLEIRWTRNYNTEDGHGRWRRPMLVVSGTNRRKDGKPGAKHGSHSYPTTHPEPDGVYTEADIRWDGYENRHGLDRDKWPDWVKAQTVFKVGTEKTKNVADPLPDWVQHFVDTYHPVTGKDSYTYGDDHVYGSFAAEAVTV